MRLTRAMFISILARPAERAPRKQTRLWFVMPTARDCNGQIRCLLPWNKRQIRSSRFSFRPPRGKHDISCKAFTGKRRRGTHDQEERHVGGDEISGEEATRHALAAQAARNRRRDRR